jgi:trehalose 6-phosphate synthase
LPRIVIVSNRVAVPRKGVPNAGGLEVVIRSLLNKHEGLWFGWSGEVSRSNQNQARSIDVDGMHCVVTDLSKEDYEEYYEGFANRVLWPILHYRADLAEYKRRDLSGYMRVNHRLAEQLHALLRPDDIVWVHDYHLIPFAKLLRALGHQNPIGFFLHIPFAPPEITAALPNGDEFFSALRDYDLVGFQTEADTANFARFLATSAGLPNHIPINRPLEASGMRIGVFPVGIDTEQFAAEAAQAVKLPYIRDVVKSVHGSLIVGVDRLDYSKGVDLRIAAYETFLKQHPAWRGRATLLQITPRSRSKIPEYAQMEKSLAEMAGRINGEFADALWTPLRYVNKAHTRIQLAGLYRAATVGLVTPLRDGMNLVAKEYVAAQDPADPGVLILSKFAGAAASLVDALLVNPYDLESVAAAIARALEMPLEERKRRHACLLKAVKQSDSAFWADSFIDALLDASPQGRSSARPRFAPHSALEAAE